jgi:type II secretory pathway pseudopilin PulG
MPFPRTGQPSSVAAVYDRRTPAAADHRTSTAGLSLPEMIIVIGCIGILAAIAVPQITNVLSTSKEQTARDTIALMNRAILHFSQTNREIVLTPLPAATTDELAVLRTLQWRDPVNPAPGSPYLPLRFPDTMSTSTDDYRIAWNGRMFGLIPPGTAGAGIRADAPASAATFPADFQPL